MIYALLVATWLVASPSQSAADGRATASGDYVPFCEVVRNPERYDQHRITTAGIIKGGPEMSDFLDPSCETGPERDVGTLPVPLGDAVHRTAGWKEVTSLLKRDHRVFVVVRGIFDAYRRYEGPMPPDPELQDILKRGNSRFGHQNFARFRLRIESVRFVAPVTK